MKNNPIGISSACFFPHDTLQSLETCASLGFESAEIFINTDSELGGDYFRRMKAFCRDNIKITSIHPFTSGYEFILFFAGYDRRIEDGIEYYKKYYYAASELGGKYVIFHGDKYGTTKMPDEQYAEIFARVAEAGKEFGVQLLHENTTISRMLYPENIRTLRRLLPEARFCFDPKQSCRGGVNAYEALEAMGDAVAHVHINDWTHADCSKGGECRLPLRGALDTERLLSRLSEVGYDGAFIFEVYNHNYKEYSEYSSSKADFCKMLCKFSK